MLLSSGSASKAGAFQPSTQMVHRDSMLVTAWECPKHFVRAHLTALLKKFASGSMLFNRFQKLLMMADCPAAIHKANLLRQTACVL